MNIQHYQKIADEYLTKLCLDIDTRFVGKEGNREATRFFASAVSKFGFDIEQPEFDCMDWTGGKISLTCADKNFKAAISTFSLGCDVEAPLAVITSIDELELMDASGKIVLLKGEIAKEQLMPKNFVFYNPEEHQKKIALLEKKNPKAIIAATTRNPEAAGGVYPFPLIEDGDFDIPSAYMTDVEGEKLAAYANQTMHLEMQANRQNAKGYNVIAGKGKKSAKKIIVCAHIDAKIGTAGAIDNATGVIVLLMLAEMLKDYSGSGMIEMLVLNGEDYYSVPGQMNYIANNSKDFPNIELMINIDGAGYYEGSTHYSKYNCPDEISGVIDNVFLKNDKLAEGRAWYQGDHSIFIQNNVPALAITSEFMIDGFNDVTHTPKDNPSIVDINKVVDVAEALNRLLLQLADIAE